MNLKSLAAHLKLSQTTVSRALAGYTDVAEGTRARVHEAAAALGYRPNAAARSLALGKARAIGIVFGVDRSPQLDPHFVEFLAGVGESAAEAEMDIVVTPAAGRESDDRRIYERLARTRVVDAVILSGPLLDDERPAVLEALGLPFVIHGHTRTGGGYACLDIDNLGAFETATRRLVALGHHRIGLINAEARFTFAADRGEGWRLALTAAGLPIDPALVSNAPMTEMEGHRATADLLALPDPPTAILCSSLLSALGCYRALREHGLEPGEDVSVIAHDDGLPSMPPDTFSPPLSTTTSPIRDHGRRLAEMAFRLAEGAPATTLREVWPVAYVERASTRARGRPARAACAETERVETVS
jgi:LacI family transcriptional regulator